MASIEGVNIYMDYQKTADQISYKDHILELEKTNNAAKRAFLGEEFDFYCYSMSEV